MDDLLNEFSGLFTEPHGLPPVQELCHRIHLKKGVDDVVVQPYRYAQLQKDELERQYADMLRQGTIRHSTSTFSSPVLLVKKSNGSW